MAMGLAMLIDLAYEYPCMKVLDLGALTEDRSLVD